MTAIRDFTRALGPGGRVPQVSNFMTGIALLLSGKPGCAPFVQPTSERLTASVGATALLNTSQKNAVQRALVNRISLVRGPPGTGKTSTIASLVRALAGASRRVLVLAPANAATLRVLESCVAAGHTDVALIASSEYLFEWHQGSVHAHLQPFIVTRAVLDVGAQARARLTGPFRGDA